MLLSQSTKEDEFRGAGNWQNVVDTLLHVHERGKMKTGEKNRWGTYGEITLFETDEK
jgi:predicted ATP-dependent serine protease